jgi:hypothetical protein
LIALIIIGEKYINIIELLIQHPVMSFLFGPDILPNTLLSNTLNLYYSLNARDQVSHPYKIRGKIIVLTQII